MPSSGTHFSLAEDRLYQLAQALPHNVLHFLVCVLYIYQLPSHVYSPETDTILYFSTSLSSGGTSGKRLIVWARVTLFRVGYLSREEVVSSGGGENGDSIVNCEHAYVSSSSLVPRPRPAFRRY